jgi:hypothetical protein
MGFQGDNVGNAEAPGSASTGVERKTARKLNVLGLSLSLVFS